MKTTRTMPWFFLAAALLSPLVSAEPAAPAEARSHAAPASDKTSRHLKLCAQLGLTPGGTYEFMISGNEEVHYWTVRSLGAKGWILVKDSRYPETWLNLSRVIAVTPVNLRPGAARAEKAKR
jgi:hypothetical protein